MFFRNGQAPQLRSSFLPTTCWQRTTIEHASVRITISDLSSTARISSAPTPDLLAIKGPIVTGLPFMAILAQYFNRKLGASIIHCTVEKSSFHDLNSDICGAALEHALK